MMMRLLAFLLLVAPLDSWVNTYTRQRARGVARWSTKTENSEQDVVNLTSLLFLVSYDGRRYNGWSAANTGSTGFVRSVEGVLIKNFSKLFGNIDPSRIVVEGTSRTDKGVHAKTMVAQVYCLSPDWERKHNNSLSAIPGKRLPHPRSSVDDRYFVPFPMDPAKLFFVLNRMLPHDLSVRGISPSPLQDGRPFHATMDAVTKTYRYSFSAGPMHDPTSWRRTWHVGRKFKHVPSDLEAVCSLLQGTHDFRAFRGAPRGKSDRKRQLDQNTVCTLFDVSLRQDTSPCPLPDLRTYEISFTGDRFVYKMVRFLVGSLIAIGEGTLTLEDLERALATGSFAPAQKPQCALSLGLSLVNVTYDTDIKWLEKGGY